MEREEIQLLIISFSIVVFTLLLSVFILFFFFQKKKSNFLIEKMEADLLFHSELANSRIEIKEETLTNISRELHDNIGQILSVALMHMNLIIEGNKDCKMTDIVQVKELVNKSLNEIRLLSKLINGDVLLRTNFIDSLSEDLNRIQLFKKITCELNVEGEIKPINNEHQIIIYRILQEAITNTLRYSHSEKITINVHFNTSSCDIEVIDYGKGFNYEENKSKGIGLMSIKKRAELLNASFSIESIENKGTTIRISYPFESITNNYS